VAVFPVPAVYREVEELMLVRGVEVSYETVRRWWCVKFGRENANALRRSRPGDTWYADEVFVRIKGKIRYLWRVVDLEATSSTSSSNPSGREAAMKFFCRLLKDLHYVPRVIVTDGLRSYGAAHSTVMPAVEHRSSKYFEQPRRELASAYPAA
jgi:putative transposase